MAPARRKPPEVSLAPRLYKYQPAFLERLHQILFEHQVYFSSPSQFSDPFDARPPVRISDREGLRRVVMNSLIKDHGSEALPLLAFYVKAVQTMCEQPDLTWVKDAMYKLLRDEMEGQRIYCLTTRPDNEYLWTHYAAGHTGFCVEFGREGVFKFAATVKYQDLPVSIDIADPNDRNATFLFVKTNRYAAEEEVRVLIPPPRAQTHEQSFPPSALRRVILGRAMSDEHRATIRRWCEECVPAVVVVEEADLAPRAA